MVKCARCDGTGFLNIHQIPDDTHIALADTGDWVAGVLAWMAAQTEPHDVFVCDCCGNGEVWYGTPGEHYGPDDRPGPRGPYEYNGGLCECN